MLLALSTQFVMHFRQRLALELGEAVVFDLRNEIFAHLQRMPMSFFNSTKLGRIISRMTTDVEDVRVGVQEVLFVSLVQVGPDAGRRRVHALVRLGAVPDGARAGAGAVADQPPFSPQAERGAAADAGVVQPRDRHAGRKRQRHPRHARLRPPGRERPHVRRPVADHAHYNYNVSRTQGLFLPLLDLNSQVFIAALLLVGGYQVLSPGSTTEVGDLVGFFFMATMFFTPITVLGNQYNQALTAMAGAERVFKLLDTPPDGVDPADAVELPRRRGQRRVPRT